MIGPDDSQLPFLVVWGDWVWKISAAVAGAVAMAAGYWLGRVRPGGRERRPSILRLLALGVGAALGVTLVFVVVGHAAAVKYRRDPTGHVPAEISNLDPLALAAASPQRREEALETLYWRLKEQARSGEPDLGRLLAAANLAEGCRGVLAQLERLMLLDEVVVWARRCKRPHLAALALLHLGQFEEAHRVIESSPQVDRDLAIDAALAARNWSSAAVAAEHAAADARQRGDAEGSERLRCLAEVFRFHEGDHDARQRLEASAAGGSGTCAMALAAVLPLPTWREQWATHASRWAAGSPLREDLWSQLQWASGADALGYGRLSTMVGNAILGVTEDPWLAEAALASRDGATNPGSPASIVAHGWRVQRDLLVGDVAQARDKADALVALVRTIDAGEQRDEAEALQGIVLLRTPEVPTAQPTGVGSPFIELRLRSGVRPGWLSSKYLDDCDGRSREGLVAAARDGDGSALARALLSCRPSPRAFSPEELLAVLPRVRTDVDVVAESLRWWARSHMPAGWYPLTWVAHAAGRRDVFRLAGMEQEARWWAAIVDRHVELVADSRMAITLLLWRWL